MAALVLVSCNSPQKERMNAEIKLPYYNEATFTPQWINEGDENYDQIHQVADFEFLNQDGEVVTHATFEGKVYVTNFFFTLCPNVCPRMAKNLKLVQEEFTVDERVKILSHTVMPWADSVERLAEYGQLNDINGNNWHLVTGDKKEIYEMARQSYFADEGFGKSVTTEEDFLHTENIILIDQNRRIRGIYNGTLPVEVKRMIEDIYTLL
jgi:protein SCO1/2